MANNGPTVTALERFFGGSQWQIFPDNSSTLIWIITFKFSAKSGEIADISHG